MTDKRKKKIVVNRDKHKTVNIFYKANLRKINGFYES